MELIKNISAVVGLIISLATVATLFSKTVRTIITKVIKKYSNIDDSSNKIDEIKKMLEEHIREDHEFQTAITSANDLTIEFAKTQCRNLVKDIFYRHCDTKTLPLYEKKTLMSIEELYVGKMHCNSYAKLLMEEMSKWDVEYDPHVSDDNEQ